MPTSFRSGSPAISNHPSAFQNRPRHTAASPLISCLSSLVVKAYSPRRASLVVDDLGEAAGLTYADDEPLQYDKVAHRDQHRWELDSRSGQEEQA